MHCGACGAEVSFAGVFPGGSVTCSNCHTALRVPYRLEPIGAGAPTPYRTARPPEPAPSPRPRPAASRPAAAGQCPRCGGDATIAPSARGADGLWECERCGGAFLAHARLRQMVDDHRSTELRPVVEPAAPSQGPSIAYVPCPDCGELMNRKNYAERSGVIVDVCRQHGVWFDRGELARAMVCAVDEPSDASAHEALKLLLGVMPRQPLVPRPDMTPLASRAERKLYASHEMLDWLRGLL